MADSSRYGKIVAGLTAAFVLFTGGWFLANRFSGQPYQVVTQYPGVAPEYSGQGSGSVAEEPDMQERPDSLMEGETIDVNTADVYDLQRLPGIGEKRAQSILEYREEHGPFQTVDELDNVSGIGPGILEELREYVTVG